jgi:hypothetical protein
LLSLPHILWGFDGRNEFEGGVSKSHKSNGSTKDVVKETISHEDRSAEDVDYENISPVPAVFPEALLQIPRPRKENRKEAYLDSCGGIWNSAQRIISM